jgi:NADPH:quinone reductase-like Zn-dependent oxidoreductase
LQPHHHDPLHLSIPESRADRVLQGWLTTWVRNGLFSLTGGRVAHYDSLFVRPDGAALQEIAGMLATEQVKAVGADNSENIFPLEDIVQAVRKLKEGHVRGKIVLRIS